MNDDPFAFNRGAIGPMQCVREGWHLIKEQYWLFVGVTFVGGLILQMGPAGILIGPIFCGFFLCLFRRQEGEPADFALLFKGFDHFMPSLVPSLVIGVPQFLMVIVAVIVYVVSIFGAIMAQAQRQQPDPFFMFGPIAIYLGLLLVIVFVTSAINMLFIFAFPLIVDRQMSGWAAVKLSARAVMGNLGGVIGLFILLVILRFCAEFVCVIGPILEAPIQVAAVAVAYRQVFPMRSALASLGLEEAMQEKDDVDVVPAASGVPTSTEIKSEEPGASA